MQKNQVELRSRVSGWPGIGQASLERHHRQWWDDEARSLAWLSTSWRHARLMMSKQAWRFVLKKEQKRERKRHRERQREKRHREREKRKLGAQHKNRLAMRHKKQQKQITTYSKDSALNISPPSHSPDTQKQYTDLRKVTPPGHMAETPTCTNCILGTQRDPSRASPLWETWRMDGMTWRGC